MSKFCTGTLIGEKVFLTAAHCAEYLQWVLADNPNIQALVTFDPTIAEEDTFYAIEQIVVNPNYRVKYGEADPGDVAVILLAQAPTGIEPARLPTVGLLDQLKEEHLLESTKFTTVGYGDVRNTIRTSFAAIQDNMDRNRVDHSFLTLTNAWLSLSANPNTGNGGGCWGDSGGPHFIYLNSVETNIIASLTAAGDVMCKAVDKTYRMDTLSVHSFLGQYVDLP
jgi:secreted trypsin-like serine protease